jgi:uncharacterized membrane protein
MTSCISCGREIGGVSFCPNCGAGQGSSVGVGGATTAAGPGGLSENVAGLLCYLFGWVSGLIFLFIDKRPFVRFHAAQSIGLFLSVLASWIVFWIVWFILGVVTTLLNFPVGWLFGLLFPLLILASVGAVIYCMYKAYKNVMFRLPVIGNLVARWVG